MSHAAQGNPVRVSLLGVPTDANSSFRRGPAKGPSKIREILRSDVGNSATESGRELGVEIDFTDAGDVEIREDAGDAARIASAISDIVRGGAVPLAIGGFSSTGWRRDWSRSRWVSAPSTGTSATRRGVSASR